MFHHDVDACGRRSGMQGAAIGGIPASSAVRVPLDLPTTQLRLRHSAALPCGPTPMTQSSAWIAGWYPQTFNKVLVLGGSDQSKPSQGILDVQVLNQPGASWNGEFLAPGATGAITITSIKGPVVQWTSASDAAGSFNLTTQKWGAS